MLVIAIITLQIKIVIMHANDGYLSFIDRMTRENFSPKEPEIADLKENVFAKFRFYCLDNTA